MLTYQQVKGRPAHRLDTPPEVLSYLAQRGISPELAQALNLKITNAAELIALARGGPQWADDSRYAIVFPHYDLTGQVLPWWSARLVGRAMPAPLRSVASFADYVDGAQTQGTSGLGKMFCPPNEPPCAYLPHAPGLPDWAVLPKGSTVYLHESAIKAINCAVLGYYAVGLNGVWGFASKRHALALLPALKSLPWRALELNPVVVYDADVLANPHVLEAATQLATRLLSITGRTATLLPLPAVPALGPKYGFDDLVHHNVALARATLAATPIPIELHPIEAAKLALSRKCCVISSISRVADIETGTLMSTGAFTELNYAHYTADIELPNGNLKEVSVPKLWLKDPRRTWVECLTYEPGQPKMCTNYEGRPSLNLWRGWGIQPAPGDISPWLSLLADNVADPTLMDWILDWLAYPLQNPGKKLNSLLLIFGPSGTGKDLFLAPMHKIYGTDNAVKISNDELKSSFTSLYSQRQFVHADELKRVKDNADAVNQKIKGLVTAEALTVNRKGDPEYKVRNTINLAITSNYFDCIKLDEDDRRATVVRWEPPAADPTADHRGDQPYWLTYVRWLHGAGASAIFYALLTRDLSRFDPAAWAFDTDSKADVIDSARTSVERYVANLKTPATQDLPPLTEGRQLFTSKELALYHYGQEPSKAQADALGNELRNQNFVRANQNKPLRTKHGLSRYVVIPREDLPDQDWQNPTVCGAHLKLHGL